MKIKVIETSIQCTADELRQSNSLADSFATLLRRSFNGPLYATTEEEEDHGENESEQSC